MQGFLDFDESFDSCITATLTLFLSNTTPSYVSLLPIPLALNCRTLNVLSSLICSAGRKGDLFVLSWAMVRRVRRGSLSSELLMCGGGVRSIFLLPLVARCLETLDVCIWRMFVFMSVVVTVWGYVGMFVV